MEIIEAKNSDELLTKLRAKNESVPPRGRGRKTKHSELPSIYHLLAAIAETNILRFPLRIEHNDRPDIVIIFQYDFSIGVEITEAVPENWARSDVVAEQKRYEEIRFLEAFNPGEPPRSRLEIDKIAKGESKGSIWEGDSVEYQWVEVIEYFANKKTKKFYAPDFKKHPKNWLLIYDNWPLPALNQQKASMFCHKKLTVNGWALPFDEIFVECFQNIWRFNSKTYMSFPFKNLWN